MIEEESEHLTAFGAEAEGGFGVDASAEDRVFIEWPRGHDLGHLDPPAGGFEVGGGADVALGGIAHEGVQGPEVGVGPVEVS